MKVNINTNGIINFAEVVALNEPHQLGVPRNSGRGLLDAP